jgi:hypothetical protein
MLMLVENFKNPGSSSNPVHTSIQTIYDGTQYFTRTLHFNEEGEYQSTELSTKKAYLTNIDKETLQPKSLKFTNLNCSNWIVDTSQVGYSYKATISLIDVTSTDVATVIFNGSDANSGNYSPICITGAGTVTIYSKVNTAIYIPTIVVEVF